MVGGVAIWSIESPELLETQYVAMMTSTEHAHEAVFIIFADC